MTATIKLLPSFLMNPMANYFMEKWWICSIFPLIDTTWPEWVPKLGGQNFRFFEPIFNIADSAISAGVGILLLFNKKAFAKEAAREASSNS